MSERVNCSHCGYTIVVKWKKKLRQWEMNPHQARRSLTRSYSHLCRGSHAVFPFPPPEEVKK